MQRDASRRPVVTVGPASCLSVLGFRSPKKLCGIFRPGVPGGADLVPEVTVGQVSCVSSSGARKLHGFFSLALPGGRSPLPPENEIGVPGSSITGPWNRRIPTRSGQSVQFLITRTRLLKREKSTPAKGRRIRTDALARNRTASPSRPAPGRDTRSAVRHKGSLSRTASLRN